MKTYQRWFRMLLAAVSLLAVANAASAKNYLLAGEYLPMKTPLVSNNGRAMAMQQNDGNFCVWGGAPAAAKPYDASWCHMKYLGGPMVAFIGKESFFVTIQTDGNLCTYFGTSPKNQGKAMWCSMAYGPVGPYYLVLDDNGNLCSHKGPDPQHDYGTMWCQMDMSGLTQQQPGVIDVSATLATLFNSDPNAWRQLAQASGANQPEKYYIESMKITQLQNTGFSYTPPQGMLWPVASKEIVNCDATQVSETVTLTGDVTNSLAVSKSKTFDTSVSATVSYSGVFASGSVTATAGFSMTDSTESTTSTTSTASDAQTIGFNDRGGRIAVLQTLRQQGKAVPWAASFTPLDTQPVNIVVRKIGNNDRVNATLQWNQIKSYLPANKQVLVLNGTLDVDQSDNKGSRITTYAMTTADVDSICAAPPLPMTSGMKSAAVAASGLAQAASAAPAIAAGGKRPTIKRDLTQAQALAIMRSQQPVH